MTSEVMDAVAGPAGGAAAGAAGAPCRPAPPRDGAVLPAGHARVPLRAFVPLTIVGCALWSAALIVAEAAGWEGAAHATTAAL